MADQSTFEIYIDIKNKGVFKTLESSAQKTHNKIDSRIRKSTNLYSGMKSQIMSIAGGFGLGLLLKETVKLGADLEQTTIAFEVMTGSAERASKLIDQINSFANATPFKNKDLQDNAKLMMNYGIATESVLPNLQMLGDIAGGDANKMRSLTLAFSQIQSTGKLMGQDLLQMINAGFNPLQIISEKTGKSMGYLKDEMSKGNVSAKMVSDAFKVATSEGGRFYGMMDKQSKSLNGMWSTFLGKFQTTISEMSSAESGPLKNFVGRLIELADKFSSNRETIIKYIKIVAKLTKYFLIFKTAMFLTQKGLLLYNTTLKIVSTTTRIMNVMTKKATLSWKMFNTALKSNVIGLAITAIATLAIKIGDIIKKQKELNNLENVGLDKAVFDNYEKYEKWLDKNTQFIQDTESGKWIRNIQFGNDELNKFNSYIEKISFENAENMLSDLERMLKDRKKMLIDSGKDLDKNNILSGIEDYQYNNYLKKYEMLQKKIENVNKSTGNNTEFDLNPSSETNKLMTELSTKRNIKNITLNIQQLTGVENINTTNITESTQEIGRLILEELNKTAAQFAVQN